MMEKVNDTIIDEISNQPDEEEHQEAAVEEPVVKRSKRQLKMKKPVAVERLQRKRSFV